MALTDAQIKDISAKISVAAGFGGQVPIPTNNDAALKTKMEAVVAANADFAAFGLGVIDFTKDSKNPKIWMQNTDKVWRLASASKIALLFAVAQLRVDVQQVMDLKIISTPAEFDALFADSRLWKLSKIKNVGQIASAPPRISALFDFGKSPIDYADPDINNPNIATIKAKITSKGGLKDATVPDFAFSELLWMAAAQSDDLAADCCISQIGVPYMKAVLRKYGLFLEDDKKGMRFLLSEGFDGKFNRAASGISVGGGAQHYRSWSGFEDTHAVTDKMAGLGFRSNQSGSPAALTAYMIAMMGNHLAEDPRIFFDGTAGCTLIRNNLSNGTPPTLGCYFANGFKSGVPAVNGGGTGGVRQIATVTRQIDKVGILNVSSGELKPDGSAGGFLVTDFVYLETQETADASKKMQYAVVALGMQTAAFAELGQPVHKALLEMNHP
ncbi:MAG TPA: hypothetical protein VN736_18700 [Candidatus Limnocylindrales bacterium]|nr:hypothetical protein [Candidatus Limnocylindrales bacterium]